MTAASNSDARKRQQERQADTEPVERLREAARVLRVRAEAATPGPWQVDCGEISQHWSRPEPWQDIVSRDVACMSYCYGGTTRGVERDEDAAYIATMHPGVGAALADWLDHEADVYHVGMTLKEALAVADQILGEA